MVQHPAGFRRVKGALAAGLAGTLLIGLWLRWRLTGLLPMSALDAIPFAYARHGHSHLGYYAVLIPLAWLAWRDHGRSSLSRTELLGYAGATLLATIGFFRSGYGVLAIIGSTVVGGLWMLAAWRTSRQAHGTDDPLHLVLPGTVAALACIPIIATSLRRDPAVAAAAVQSFLAALLFLVVAPSAMVARQLRLPTLAALPAVPLSLAAGALSALALGLWPSVPTRVGLALLALTWSHTAWMLRATPAVAAAWLLAVLGLLGLSLGLIPNTHDVGIAAVHFLVLGPLLPSLAARHLAPQPSATGWWLHLIAVLGLTGPLLLRRLLAGNVSATASALGGSAVVLWWGVQGLRAWRRARAGSAASGESRPVD